MRNRFSILAFLLFFPPWAISGELLPPPAAIEFNSKLYKIVSNTSTQQSIYLYTTNNEKSDDWSSLITITFEKVIFAEPNIWSSVTATRLSGETPRPTFRIFEKDNHSFARIIFEPKDDRKFFESIVRKSFHIGKCDDVVGTFQISEKYLFPTNKSFDEKKQMMMKIYPENGQLAEKVEKFDWAPTCKAD